MKDALPRYISTEDRELLTRSLAERIQMYDIEVTDCMTRNASCESKIICSVNLFSRAGSVPLSIQRAGGMHRRCRRTKKIHTERIDMYSSIFLHCVDKTLVIKGQPTKACVEDSRSALIPIPQGQLLLPSLVRSLSLGLIL